MILKILAAWFLISIPVNLLVGALIRAGRGHEWEEDARYCRNDKAGNQPMVTNGQLTTSGD
jgi:hypothetical protein